MMPLHESVILVGGFASVLILLTNWLAFIPLKAQSSALSARANRVLQVGTWFLQYLPLFGAAILGYTLLVVDWIALEIPMERAAFFAVLFPPFTGLPRLCGALTTVAVCASLIRGFLLLWKKLRSTYDVDTLLLHLVCSLPMLIYSAFTCIVAANIAGVTLGALLLIIESHLRGTIGLLLMVGFILALDCIPENPLPRPGIRLLYWLAGSNRMPATITIKVAHLVHPELQKPPESSLKELRRLLLFCLGAFLASYAVDFLIPWLQLPVLFHILAYLLLLSLVLSQYRHIPWLQSIPGYWKAFREMRNPATSQKQLEQSIARVRTRIHIQYRAPLPENVPVIPDPADIALYAELKAESAKQHQTHA